MHRSFVLAAALLLFLAACREEGESPEQREARRAACIADELALQGKERLASLDTALARARGTPLEQVTVAGHAFAATYAAFANRRLAEAANLDSAAHAREPEDSARFARAAAPFRDPAPAPGTVQGNVAERWRSDFTAAAGNPDHPCNLEPEEQ